MDTISFSTSARSLSSSYTGLDLRLKSSKYVLDTDSVFFKTPLLNNINAVKINNYSTLYLTDKILGGEVFEFDAVENSDLIDVVTPISVRSQNNLPEFFYIEDTTTDTRKNNYACTLRKLDDIYIDSRRYFEIQFIDNIFCRIAHNIEGVSFYLAANSANEVYFSKDFGEFNDNIDASVFEYYINDKSLSLVKHLSGDSGLQRKTLSHVGDKLTLTPYNTGGGNLLFSSNAKFDISNTNQSVIPKLNVSWISYKQSENNIDIRRSQFDQKVNYLASTQYSYVTGNKIDVSLFPLKNTLADNNTVLRGDYMTQYVRKTTPNVNQRSYKSLNTGRFEETGNDNIGLTYTFYNKTYDFAPDEYTAFTAPDNLYPYTQLDINDSLFYKCGSLPGDSPHTSDRIFSHGDNDQNNIVNNGTYLCTWLSGGSTNEIWLDRYYIPEKTNVATALSSSTSTIFNYKGLGQSIKDANNITEDFFDVQSSLAFKPSKEYIYQRIGPNYVSRYLEHLDDSKIIDRLSLKSSTGAILPVPGDDNIDNYAYDLQNSYYLTNFNDLANLKSELTLSFWLKKKDWTKSSGHQIIGSYTNQGISVTNDRAITPFITIQNRNNREIDIYNTVGKKLFSITPFNSQSSERIIDIVRTYHLSDIYVITDARNVYKIQSNGATYDSKKIIELSGYVNYFNEGDNLYILENTNGKYLKLNINTEEIIETGVVSIPEEDGTSYDIRSIVTDNKGNVVGFRGEKSIKYDDKYALSLVEGVALIKESYDHVERTIVADSDLDDSDRLAGIPVKDFAVYDEFIYVLKGNTILKINNDNIVSFRRTLRGSTAVALDFVREYHENELKEYPIVVSEDRNNVNAGRITIIDESSPQSTTYSISSKVQYYGKCNTPIRFNLTNYKFLKDARTQESELQFNFKVKNLNNNQDFLQTQFTYNVSRFIPGSKHHFAIKVDTTAGYISLFIDGEKYDEYEFEPAKYKIGNILNDGFCIGSTNFYNNILLAEVLKRSNIYFCNDLQMEQPRFFNEAVDDIDIKFLYLNNIKINKLTAALPAGINNKSETIKTFFKWQGSISKSTDINLILKGSNLRNDEDLSERVKQRIMDDVSKALPVSTNIKNIHIK